MAVFRMGVSSTEHTETASHVPAAMAEHAATCSRPAYANQAQAAMAMQTTTGSETADGRMNGAGFGELGADYQTINATETAIALLRLCYLEGHNAAS